MESHESGSRPGRTHDSADCTLGIFMRGGGRGVQRRTVPASFSLVKSERAAEAICFVASILQKRGGGGFFIITSPRTIKLL